MAPETHKIQTTFRIEQDLLRKFQHALLDRGEKMSPKIETFIRSWLNENVTAMEEPVVAAGNRIPPDRMPPAAPATTTEPTHALRGSDTSAVSPPRSSSPGTAPAAPHALVPPLPTAAGTSSSGSKRAPESLPGAANPWLQILRALEKKVSRHQYDTWLKPTLFSHASGGVIFVRVPTAEFHHIEDKFGNLINEVMDASVPEFQEVKLVTAEEDPGPPTGGVSVATTQFDLFDWDFTGQLNPRYNFDAFVIGMGNQFAHAAAQAVAERPSSAYNPLFLYSGVGMGKTHLMQAIGLEIRRRNPKAVICYMTSEKFTNEMIKCLRYDRMTRFRDSLRNVDVLLMDDIQFFAQKERTQEEFFHTFNALYEAGKQIVIASDRPPKELGEVADRLRSRFEWGLIADIQPPDLETKVAILQRKAESERVTLPTDLALYIASNVRTNVRELEGALIRLVAYASLTGAEISLTTAHAVLKSFLESQTPKITIESVQKAVAEQFGLRVAEIKSKSNFRAIAFPRQIGMYVAKELTGESMSEIGRQFGGKHPSTVLYSVSKIEKERQADKDLNRLLNKLTEVLKS